LQPDFRLHSTIQNLPCQQGVTIWSPQPDELDQAGIPASWNITSDSLAAWLAGQVAADELILVKATPVPAEADLPTLRQLGIIDAAFCDFAQLLACPIKVIQQASFC